MESNKEFVDLLRKAISVTRGRISEREVFRDFIAFCALQLSVLTDPVHPERAEQLQKIKENYEAEELTAFSQTFLELAQIIERNIDQGVYEDLLGMAYNECGATNRALEQVFTPPDVARLMAQFVFGQPKELPSEGHFTINPASQEKDEIETGQRILRVGDKVMQMKNRDFASNGDIGYICTSKRDSDGILVEVDFGDDRVVAYEDAESLRQVELAYAATIHKSQGSEYDAVLINIQNMHGKMLNRALIYTAETRAKKQVIIVGDWEAVVRAIQTADTKRRNTMLAVRINDLTKE